jgi:hypothetical protein
LVQKRARIHIDIDNKPRAKKKDTTQRNLKPSVAMTVPQKEMERHEHRSNAHQEHSVKDRLTALVTGQYDKDEVRRYMKIKRRQHRIAPPQPPIDQHHHDHQPKAYDEEDVRKYMVKKARLAEQKKERARIEDQLQRSQVQERLDRLNEYRREQLKNVRPKIETYCGPERTPMQSYSNNSIFGHQYDIEMQSADKLESLEDCPQSVENVRSLDEARQLDNGGSIRDVNGHTELEPNETLASKSNWSTVLESAQALYDRVSMLAKLPNDVLLQNLHKNGGSVAEIRRMSSTLAAQPHGIEDRLETVKKGLMHLNEYEQAMEEEEGPDLNFYEINPVLSFEPGQYIQVEEIRNDTVVQPEELVLAEETEVIEEQSFEIPELPQFTSPGDPFSVINVLSRRLLDPLALTAQEPSPPTVLPVSAIQEPVKSNTETEPSTTLQLSNNEATENHPRRLHEPDHIFVRAHVESTLDRSKRPVSAQSTSYDTSSLDHSIHEEIQSSPVQNVPPVQLPVVDISGRLSPKSLGQK